MSLSLPLSQQHFPINALFLDCTVLNNQQWFLKDKLCKFLKTKEYKDCLFVLLKESTATNETVSLSCSN